MAFLLQISTPRARTDAPTAPRPRLAMSTAPLDFEQACPHTGATLASIVAQETGWQLHQSLLPASSRSSPASTGHKRAREDAPSEPCSVCSLVTLPRAPELRVCAWQPDTGALLCQARHHPKRPVFAAVLLNSSEGTATILCQSIQHAIAQLFCENRRDEPSLQREWALTILQPWSEAATAPELPVPSKLYTTLDTLGVPVGLAGPGLSGRDGVRPLVIDQPARLRLLRAITQRRRRGQDMTDAQERELAQLMMACHLAVDEADPEAAIAVGRDMLWIQTSPAASPGSLPDADVMPLLAHALELLSAGYTAVRAHAFTKLVRARCAVRPACVCSQFVAASAGPATPS